MKSLGASMEVAEQWIGRKIKGWQNEIDKGNVVMLSTSRFLSIGNKFNAEPGTFDAQSFGFVPIMIHKLEEQSALQSKVVASLKIPVEDTKHPKSMAAHRCGCRSCPFGLELCKVL